MMRKSRNVVGEEEVGGRRDEYSTSIVGKNEATSGVAGATSFVPNNWTCVQLDTESYGGMVPVSHQDPSSSFDRRRIGNSIAVNSVGNPSCVEDLYCQFK